MGEVEGLLWGAGVGLQHTSGDALPFSSTQPARGRGFFAWPCRPLLGVQPSSHFLIGLAAAGQASAHF